MDGHARVYDTISSGNVEGLTQILQTEDYIYFFCNINRNVKLAVETGNTEIIRVIARAWPYGDPKEFDSVLLCIIPTSSHNVDKKLEMIKVLLPNLCSEDPLSFYPLKYLFKGILCCCASQDWKLVEFFINNCYSEKYNSHYPLIKELEGSVDGWQHLCVLLHDEIDFSIYDFEISSIHFKNIAETFFKLLVNDTRESMMLAVKTFQALLNTNFCGALDRYMEKSLCTDNIPPVIEKVLNDSFLTKLLFQLVYNSINDETLDEVIRIIQIICLCSCNIMELSREFLSHFRVQPMQADQNGFFSLKELSGDVIRHRVIQNVYSVKKFMASIWELNLPTTVKCFLLHIPDASWMNNLQMS